MFSFFKKKIVVPHVRLTGVIGAAGRFKQGMDLAGQKAILKKAFSFHACIKKKKKKVLCNIVKSFEHGTNLDNYSMLFEKFPSMPSLNTQSPVLRDLYVVPTFKKFYL